MTTSPAQNPIRFGIFELDPKGRQLKKKGLDVRLPQQPLTLLCLLVDRPNEVVTREELRKQLWPSDVFVDFDHGLNKSIQKLRDALGDTATSPRYIETIPRVGYRFIAPVSAGPESPKVSLPEPPSRSGTNEHSADGTDEVAPSAHHSRRSIAKWFLFAGGIALLGVLGAWSIKGRLTQSDAVRSLAVLPLQNLSGDAAQDYFADGMTDELVTMLARDSSLRIISRTSVMQYKNARRPLVEIARELHVDGIVEGSVSRSKDKVHLNLQLIRADSDTHLWAQSYDRDFDDTHLPSEAAAAIAKRLRSYVGTEAKVRYVNPQAHDALLRGKYLWFTDKLMESGPYFRRAAEIQPDYADAWAWLAAYYGEAYAANMLEPRESLQPMWDSAQRAMQLDPSLPDAHWALGAAYFLARWDWANADREFQQAISMNPQNAEYYYVRANLLEVQNRFDEAIEIEKKAMELDPIERPEGLASMYIGARQYDAALADIQLRMQAFPNSPALIGSATEAWRRKGDLKQAEENWARWHLAVGDANSAAEIRRAYASGGSRGFIEWELKRRLLQSKTSFVSPGELALYYAQLGDKERTLKLLEESLAQHTIDAIWIETEPAFDNLHTDPRYLDLVRRTGLPPIHDQKGVN